MKHGLIAGIAAIAIALGLGALFANWEGADQAAMIETPMQEGRAATTVDPIVAPASTSSAVSP
jgi:hypothetical protein